MTNIHHNNYKVLYAQLLEEVVELRQDTSDTYEFFGDQLITATETIAKQRQEIERLENKLNKRKLQWDDTMI